MHVSNNEQMSSNHTEVLVYRRFTRPTKIPLVKGIHTVGHFPAESVNAH